MIKVLIFFKNLFVRKPKTVEEVRQIPSERERFENAMKFVRVIEGGKFFHKNDPGGFTNMGLTQRDYPNLDLKKLTRKQADEIFFTDYWNKSSANILPHPAYISYFDAVVNTGKSRANKILQKTLNLKEDGVIGPITESAIKNVKDPIKFALDLADGKQKFYERLVRSNTKFKSFIKGWTRRNIALRDYIKTGAFSW